MYKWHTYANNSVSHNHVNNLKVMTHVRDQLGKLEDLILSKESAEGNALFTFSEYNMTCHIHIRFIIC